MMFCKKVIIALIILSIYAIPAAGQQKQAKLAALPDSTKAIQVVEVSCGQCQFDMPGKSCDLAIRLKGRPYFVDGTHIDSHGDAHGKEGFCEMIRKAEVQGEIVGDRFKVTYFKLLPPVKDPVKDKEPKN